LQELERLLKLVIDFLHIQHVILAATYSILLDIFRAIWLFLSISILREPMKSTAQGTRNPSE